MFWQLFKEHVAGIPESPIARHFNSCTLCNLNTIRFQAIDRIHPNPQGEDFDKISEYQWIFTLRPNYPPGLNGFVSYAPFLCKKWQWGY